MLATSYKQELLQGGTHLYTDTYKIALYTSSATLDATTTAYTASNEVASGNGYTTGGQALTGASVTVNGSNASLDFADAVWTTASITARYALVYNSSKSNKAVAIIDFGSNITSTNADFTVTIANLITAS